MKKMISTLLLGSLLVLSMHTVVAEETDSGSTEATVAFTTAELNDLVARIALYPDPLLAQILPASTYPLEIVEAARIIKSKNDANKIDQHDWDPSVQAVAHYPTVLKMMSEDIEWTQKLGQAVIAQQDDVMDAVQTMREKADNAGSLKTTKEQVVVKEKKVIQIVPASPEVVYVPVYDPVVVYTVPVYAHHYPVITYSYFYPMGSWLNISFVWHSHHIHYCHPHWWHGGWYAHNHYHPHATSISFNFYRKSAKAWKHNNKRGTPFSGGNTSIHKKTASKTNSSQKLTGSRSDGFTPPKKTASLGGGKSAKRNQEILQSGLKHSQSKHSLFQPNTVSSTGSHSGNHHSTTSKPEAHHTTVGNKPSQHAASSSAQHNTHSSHQNVSASHHSSSSNQHTTTKPQAHSRPSYTTQSSHQTTSTHSAHRAQRKRG